MGANKSIPVRWTKQFESVQWWRLRSKDHDLGEVWIYRYGQKVLLGYGGRKMAHTAQGRADDEQTVMHAPPYNMLTTPFCLINLSSITFFTFHFLMLFEKLLFAKTD